MNREPVITIAGIGAAAAAVITLLVAFGVPLTEAQTVAVLGVVAAVGPLVVALLARRRVTPVIGVPGTDNDADGGEQWTPPAA